MTIIFNFLSEAVPVYLSELLQKGQASAAFAFALQQIEAFNDFWDETEEEIREIKAFVLDGFKWQLAKAISQTNTHCGNPIKVAGTYNFESSEHDMEVTCSICGAYHKIKAAPATTHSESGQALIPMPS